MESRNGYKDRNSDSNRERNEEVFSRRVRAGKRTYFVDVKSTKSENDLYITITESKKISEDEYKKHKIFLYKEDFDKFVDALEEAIVYVEENVPKKSFSPRQEGSTEQTETEAS